MAESSEEKILLVTLTQDQLKDIYRDAAEIGAKEGLRAFEAERRRERDQRRSRKLHNTKLLLRNYHMLKEHAENSVFGRAQMGESAADILESMMNIYDNEVIIESIKRSATRTAVIVSHIETMFQLYEAYCEKSANPEIERRRYETAWDLYMTDDPLTIDEIAEKHHVSQKCVYADQKIAIERLSALIFGVDGLKLQ